jgi:hypothetical protein
VLPCVKIDVNFILKIISCDYSWQVFGGYFWVYMILKKMMQGSLENGMPIIGGYLPGIT